MKLRWPILLVALVTVALAGVHAGGLLRLIFPALAILLGLYLEGTNTRSYLVFVMWLWALAPLVRRLADLQAGWQDPSLIILTPYLVTGISVAQMFLRALVLRSRPLPLPAGAMVFVFIAVGAAMGMPMGFLRFPSTAFLETLNWLLPPAFAWRVATLAERRLPEFEQAVVTTFQEIALVSGLYGVFQLMAPPLWDTEWMRNVAMTSIGSPAPFELRVFSTMHSPGILAFFVLVPLTIWLARPRLTGVPAACCASAALLMSQVRAAWLGFGVAVFLVAAGLPTRLRFRMLLLVPIVVLGLTPFVTMPDIGEPMSARLATLSDPSTDGSAQSRLAGHAVALDFVASHPFGGGIGYTDSRLEEFIGMRDSVFVAALVQFGIIGGLAYIIGFTGLLVLMWGYYRSARTSERLGLASAGFAIIATAPLGAVSAGPTGILLWTIGGLAAASRARALARVRRPAAEGLFGPAVAAHHVRVWG